MWTSSFQAFELSFGRPIMSEKDNKLLYSAHLSFRQPVTSITSFRASLMTGSFLFVLSNKPITVSR